VRVPWFGRRKLRNAGLEEAEAAAGLAYFREVVAEVDRSSAAVETKADEEWPLARGGSRLPQSAGREERCETTNG